MPTTLDDILQQALTLPDDSRLLLAEELVASISVPVQVDDVLVERRRADYLAGTARLIPAEEALRQAREELAGQARA